MTITSEDIQTEKGYSFKKKIVHDNIGNSNWLQILVKIK